MRMRKPPQNSAFPLEALFASLPEQCNVEKLDGYATLEATVGALTQPDTPHPTLTEK